MRPLALVFALAAATPSSAVTKEAPAEPLQSFSPNGVVFEDKPEPFSNQTLACLILSEEDCGRNANAARMITVDARNVKLAPPTFQERFADLAEWYPGKDPMGRKIGVQGILDRIGQPTQTWIKNTCAIRVTYAMNHSKVQQFQVNRSYIQNSPTRIEVISHGGPERASYPYVYLFRVNELAAYMLRRYGRPQVWAQPTSNMRQKLHGKRGIILFVVNGWSDATGHFDVWDRDHPLGDEYFDKASDVFLWE